MFARCVRSTRTVRRTLAVLLAPLGVSATVLSQSCPDVIATWGGANDDFGVRVVAASQDRLRVVGSTDSFGANGLDGLLLEYDVDGNLLGSRTWGGNGAETFGHAIEDAAGNVYVGGSTTAGAGMDDILMMKFDNVGQVAWSRTFGGAATEEGSFALDASGNFYAVGETRSTAGNQADVLLVKYNSSGGIVFAKTWGLANDEGVNSCCIAGGALYAVGNTKSHGPTRDALLLSYDLATGNVNWAQTWGTDDGSDDAFEIAADPDGDLFVVGRTDSFGASQPFLAKLDGQGNLLWDVLWDDDDPSFVSTDAAGNAYVSASTDAGGTDDAALLKFAPDGSLDWARSWGSAGTHEVFGAVAFAYGATYLPVVRTSCAPGDWQTLTRTLVDPNVSLDPALGIVVPAPGMDLPAVGTSGMPTGSGCSSGNADVWLLRTGPPEPLVYCTAKTALVCGPPAISASGCASASANSGFSVAAAPARGAKLGLVLYTDAGRAAIPFQGGLLCLAPPLKRTTPVNSGGTPNTCSGVLDIDMNAFAAGLLGGNPAAFLSSAGTLVNCQFWGRDSVATGSLLSDGLEYTVGP